MISTHRQQLVQIRHNPPPMTDPTPDSDAEHDRLADAPEPADGPQLTLDAIVDPSINFAAFHNAVPPIKRLTVTHTGTSDTSDLTLRLWVDRDLSGVFEHRLERLDAGQSLVLDNLALPLRADTLAHLTERDSADLHAEIRCAGDVVCERVWPIDALAFDEWAGVRALPELLAAFVTPNHPAIERLLGDARQHLERATRDRALSGYQRKDPARVRATVEAVYRAVGDLGLSYINPPASFEERGQRVRLADQLLERRMGTCLDLTLLLAGLLEQAGLHPLLIMLRGHAFVGVWLSEERFPEPAVAEPLRLRKRVQLDDILVVETTGLTRTPPNDFDGACADAARQLADASAFHYVVDVRTARLRHIRPLPLRVKPGTYDLIDLDRAAHETTSDDSIAPNESLDHATEATRLRRENAEQSVTDTDNPDDAFAVDLADSSATATRLDNWKRKLLDLSLRNRVLNHRETKKTIPLQVPNAGELEDRLSQGRKFDIQPRAELMDGQDPRSAEMHEQRTGEDARRAFLNSDIADGRLHADLAERELDKRLVEVYRAARLGLEESGANTLYLAFGFLSWYETQTSQAERLAPILLVPAALERLPAGRGYRLSLLDEDPQINATLLEKLRTEYDIDTAGLEELSEDASGLDIDAIFRRFREVVKDVPRWDVVERVDLSLFSFNKFLMWRDLQERSEQLAANPVVRRLVDPDSAYAEAHKPLPDPARLDAERRPDQTLCPMDADSSQLAAVFAADDGHSFVLEGPPGTGKSQTITNLIAHALSQGKRVLFVSEKRAALEVVHRRLEKIGLGPFCLELHSNKANKRAVLEQLGEALDFAPIAPPDGWQAHADQLQETRSQLNALVDALHRDRPIGMSVFQVGCELVERKGTPQIDLGLDDIADLTAERFAQMSEAVDRLATAATAVGVVEQHPYRAANPTRYTKALPDDLRAAITPAEEAVEQVGEDAAALLPVFGFNDITPAELSADAMGWLVELGRQLAEPFDPTPKLLTEPGFEGVRDAVIEQIKLGRARDQERDQLLQRYDARVFNEDLGTVRAKLAEGMTALPVISWFKCYGPRKRLKLSLKPGAVLPKGAALLDDLDALIRVRDWTMGLGSESNPGCVYTGGAWLKGEAQWNEVHELLGWAERYREHFDQPAAVAFGDTETLRKHMLRLAIDERTTMRAADTETRVEALNWSANTLSQRLCVLDKLMDADPDPAWGARDEPGRLDTIASTLEAWRSDPGLLRNWCYWCEVRAAARSLGLSALIGAHAGRSVPAGRLAEVFRKSLLAQWYSQVTADEPALAGFHRLDQERQIERFCALDEHHLDLTAEQVRAELSRRLPLHTPDAPANSEVGILRRQMKLKRRHMPVRKLIFELPNLLPRLKPCLLMSPLSVAQYLDTPSTQGGDSATTPFDLVVFDEASQIPVWDAVGALGRGASCVVVGDSKQLPPTSFFQKLESDDDVADENDFVELESILDECGASGLPSMRLLWHYRSRHESLIAFSNAHYYDHRLNTFPSPADESDALGVTLKQIDGVYDRGDTRTNRAEADALIADVVARLQRADRDGYRGLGIVTFSMAQQTLIEDLLDQARRDHPSIDRFFGDAVDEPVFVKNLENVQGDERAAIYFSVCYGPDESGKVAMNFGPLNREGGERRLNVAVTRARESVVVYSSLRAEQIDLSRTQAVGVAHLRGFLEYAERGAAAIANERSTSDTQRPTPIEHALADGLRARGYEVDLRVGLSGYRVALAVRDPDRADAYLLGIELDGPIYAGAATARDRDRTRPGVMRGLGWRLHRVWSADYLHDPDAEIDRIEEAIDKAKRGEPIASVEESPEPVADESRTSDRARRASTDGSAVYEPFVPNKPEGDSEAYYNPAKTARVRRTLLKIAKREAPIHEDLLAKRLTLAWQVGRLTSKAAERATVVIDSAIEAGEVKRVGRFVWLAEQDPQRYDTYRVPADGDDAPRDIDEVPTAELEQAALAVLRRTIALPREDLMREVAELFGLSRLTPRVQPIIDEAVQSLLDRGRCVIDASGKVALP
jgi:very-short-patch-repair endonuclease